jgi:tetratricopeptide (TPR) repeat protein
MDRWAEAVSDYERALEYLIDTGDAYVHAMTLGNLADVLRHLGDLDAAYGYAETALEESLVLQSEVDIVLAHLNLGETLLDKGEPQRARREHLEVGLETLQVHEIVDLLPQAELDIAQSYLQEGNLEEAGAAAERAWEAASEPISWSHLGVARRVMGQAVHQQGRVDEGEDLLRESIEILEQHGPRYELARGYLALGRAAAQNVNRRDEALETLGRARAIFQELGAKLDLERVTEFESQLAAGDSSPKKKRSEGDG